MVTCLIALSWDLLGGNCRTYRGRSYIEFSYLRCADIASTYKSQYRLEQKCHKTFHTIPPTEK